LIAMQQLGLQKKELSVVKHVLEQMRLAITVHKNKRDRESSRLYQFLLNIVSSPPAARLQRATARTVWTQQPGWRLRSAALRPNL